MDDGTPPRGRGAFAHTMPSWFGRPLVPAVAIPPPRRTNFDPVAPPGRPARAHLYPFFSTSTGIKQTLTAGFGTAGAATLVLSLERGTAVSFGWATTIIPSYSGKEQRESMTALPQRRFDGPAFLRDAQSRDMRGTMQHNAARGFTFLLALPFEALTITADSPVSIVAVSTTALSDWALPGQRCVIVQSDGAVTGIVIQAVTTTTLRVAVVDASGVATTTALGTAGRAGGRIMPLAPVILESQQKFSRYPVTVDLWSIRAQSTAFGWCGIDAMGIGASIATYTVGAPVPVASLTDFDLLVWDKRNAIDGTAGESMDSHAEILDLGAVPLGAGAATVPDWTRSLKFRSSKRADWQYWKAFTRLCRGRQRAFLLSTNRPDLVFDSTFTGGMKVKSATVIGAGDYASWFTSPSHRRLAVTMTNGSLQYVEVLSVTDNLDGTLSLALDADVTGTVAKISLLEAVRFERDQLVATWNGAVFEVDEVVRAVQDSVDAPSRNFFDRDIVVNFAYSGIPPDVPPAIQAFGLNLGKVTIVHFTSDRSLSFSGLHQTGGNVDGSVVCFVNSNTTGSGFNLVHESVDSVLTDRFWNAGQSSQGGAGRCIWYRYRSALGRWVQIM